MPEEEARRKIIAWAKHYFSNYGEDEEPESVKVLDIEWDSEDENWVAELEVSTVVDNPTVIFFERPQELGGGLQIVGVEY